MNSKWCIGLLTGILASCGGARGLDRSEDAHAVVVTVEYVEPASVAQSTAAGLHQTVVCHLTGQQETPPEELRMRLLIRLSREAAFVRPTPGGLILDERIIKPGTELSVSLPSLPRQDPAGCIWIIVGPDDQIDTNAVPGTEKLPCYLVSATNVTVVAPGAVE